MRAPRQKEVVRSVQQRGRGEQERDWRVIFDTIFCVLIYEYNKTTLIFGSLGEIKYTLITVPSDR